MKFLMNKIVASTVIAVLGFILIGIYFAAYAGPNNCGPVPKLPFKLESSQNLKGQLSVKANLLSKLVGKAGLKLAASRERTRIYNSADKNLRAWKVEYLTHMFCSLVMVDDKLNLDQKISAIKKFKLGMSANVDTKKNPCPAGTAICASGGSHNSFIDNTCVNCNHFIMLNNEKGDIASGNKNIRK